MPNTIQALKEALAKAEQIEKLKAELASILGQVPRASRSFAAGLVAASATMTPAVTRKKPRFSKAARAAISAAQKARWAIRKGKAAKPAAKTSKPKTRKKGTMSAAGRANIVKAQKARWAKIKAGKGK